MTLYSAALKAHLARYKRDTLGVAEHGVWRRNGREYEHVLPEGSYQLNILETIRSAFWPYFESRRAVLATHTDFAHLNSSQAFAFNFFFPFFGLPESRPAALLEALGVTPRLVERWDFEAIPDGDERTTFDFLMVLERGARVLVEVKLSETNFGTCVDDPTHRSKLEKRYRGALAGKTAREMLDAREFFAHYQLFRNLSHLDVARGDRLVLLVPRANETAWAEARTFISTQLSAAVRDHVRLVAMEDAVASLEQSTASDPFLREHLRLLRAKYFVSTAP